MMIDRSNHLRALIERLARLSESEDWNNDLNPAQMAALRYLAVANRFSRAPSHVAAFSGSTRGTVSQTLRALERKGLVTEARSENDRRSISYSVTDAGLQLVSTGRTLDRAVTAMQPERIRMIEMGLGELLRGLLAARGGKPFGVCHQCRHHEHRGFGGYCRLLHVDLEPAERDLICHEQEPA